MAQRLTQQRQLYYGVESTEGDEVVGTQTEAILVSNLTMAPDRAFNARAMVGALGSYTGKMGAQTDPNLSFTCELKGSGSGADYNDLPPEIDELLKTVFPTRTLNTGSTTTSASCTTTQLKVGDSSGFTAGNAIAVEKNAPDAGTYEVAWISSVPDGTTINVSEALSFTPGTGNSVKPSLTYAPKNDSHQSLSFQTYLDSAKAISFVGCKGSAKIDVANVGQPATITFNWKAMNWVHGSHTRPTPTYDSTVPPVSKLFKVDSTATDVKLVNWDLGQTVARKMSQNSTYGTFAQLVTNRALKGSFQAYDIDETQFDGWNNGDEFVLSHQIGDSLFNMVAYRIPKAQRAKVGYGDDNGMTTDQIDFQGNIAKGADEVAIAYL